MYYRIPSYKTKEREKLKDDIQEFLAKGGKIEVVPSHIVGRKNFNTWRDGKANDKPKSK